MEGEEKEEGEYVGKEDQIEINDERLMEEKDGGKKGKEVENDGRKRMRARKEISVTYQNQYMFTLYIK